jgi:tetratricopeptide (TPR) repeat protein
LPPPSDAWRRYDPGRSHLRAGRFAETKEQFEAASRDRHLDFWPCFYLGICAYHLDEFEEATAAFRVCEAPSPASAECSHNYTLALERRGRFDFARSASSRAILLDAGLSAAGRKRGILNCRRGDDDAAIADYDAAIRLNGDPSIRRTAEESHEIARIRLGHPVRANSSEVRP